jgi:hypothetical protein
VIKVTHPAVLGKEALQRQKYSDVWKNWNDMEDAAPK